MYQAQINQVNYCKQINVKLKLTKENRGKWHVWYRQNTFLQRSMLQRSLLNRLPYVPRVTACSTCQKYANFSFLRDKGATCQRAKDRPFISLDVPTCQRRTNVLKACQLFSLACQCANVSNWRAKVPKRVLIF